MSKVYRCCECGNLTSTWNEGQCPECKTSDSLYLINEYQFNEENGIFDTLGEENLSTEEY